MRERVYLIVVWRLGSYFFFFFGGGGFCCWIGFSFIFEKALGVRWVGRGIWKDMGMGKNMTKYI